MVVPKFKGIDKTLREWVVGYPYVTHGGEVEIGYYDEHSDIERITSVVFPESVCISTGHFDEGGKEVFEGDILLIDSCQFTVCFGVCGSCDNTEKHGYLGFHLASALKKFPLRNDIEFWLSEYPAKIIGNIHDYLLSL